MSAKPFYLTTPIYYVNARPHIGHAYTTIVGDVLARRHRLLGEDVYFLTGTDEHGQKIERSAAAAGIPPQQFADQVSASFETLWKRMGITHNDYIRTTEPRHKLGAQKLFATLYEKGFIYLASYTGSYCVSDEAFIDAPVGTPCPDCGRLLEEVTEENFFFKLSAFQEKLLEDIYSKRIVITPEAAENEVLSFLAGPAVSVAETFRPETPSERDNWTIGLGLEEGFAKGLLKKVVAIENGVTKTLYYIPGRLKDLSISRSSFTWGIPVPEPAASQAKQPHVIYVWLDALANYMTALGYGSDDETLWQKFWPADLHLVGKEITRFHCVYWPAFLLAAGLPLPKQITANGWLLFDNAKMSKSKGNIVRTETILDAFGTLCPDAPSEPLALGPEPSPKDLFAADILRYYLLREIPFGQDGSFTFDALITRYNADLANGYGNLVSRTLSMISKRGGVYPTPANAAYDPDFMSNDVLSYSSIKSAALEIEADTSQLNFNSALTKIASLITLADGYMTQYTPWKLVNSTEPIDQKKADFILLSVAESIRIITALLYPILPYATARVWKQLGFEKSIEQAAVDGDLKDLQWGGLEPGTKLGPLAPIFPRAPKELAQMMIENEEKLATGNSKPETVNPTPSTTAPDAPPRALDAPSQPLPVAGSAALTTGPDPNPLTTNHQPLTTDSPQIAIDDFAKIDLRVAQIVLAERIPKADKLLRLEVDLGPLGRRQILSGIAEHYTPEELLGRRIIVIANLAPRKMRGLESHGMLLAASEGDHGKPHLATCGEEIALGSRLK